MMTRKPTGKPPWPMLLLAGIEKSGKSYAAAAASASDHIGRTLWISAGEDDPDEYGALDGARFEIVMHDGTYRSILAAIRDATQQPETDGKPNLIVLDSIGRIWDMLADMAQAEANRRKKQDEAVITMDQWNIAKQRWQHIMTALKSHPGPVIVTARLEWVTVLDSAGKPTAEKVLKVKAEKSLPFDVGAIVEIRGRGEYYLTGVRSLKFKPAPGVSVEYPDFTVEKLWKDLGVLEPDATSPRHTSTLEADPDAIRQAKSAAWEATKTRIETGVDPLSDHGKAQRTTLLTQALTVVGTTPARAGVDDYEAALLVITTGEVDNLTTDAEAIAETDGQPYEPDRSMSDAEWREEYRADDHHH